MPPYESPSYQSPHVINQGTLKRLRQEDPRLKALLIGTNSFAWRLELKLRPETSGFVPTTSFELEELGRHIADNHTLQKIEIHNERWYAVQLEPLVNGIKQNTSINELYLGEHHLSNGCGRQVLGAFQSRGTLTILQVKECSFDGGGERCISSAIERCKKLVYISIKESRLSANQLVPIAGAVRNLHRLKVLELTSNDIGNEGCEIIASLLRDPRCNLNIICLDDNGIGDRGCIALANALSKNNKNFTKNNVLNILSLGDNQVTAGWKTMYHAVCDTSSIDATYMSNHSLHNLGVCVETLFPGVPFLIPFASLLELNQGTNKRLIAMQKVLTHHPPFDMKPLFEWKLKILPLMVSWYDEAKACNVEGTGAMKLDSIYQFTKAMPMAFVEHRPEEESWLSHFSRLHPSKIGLGGCFTLFAILYGWCKGLVRVLDAVMQGDIWPWVLSTISMIVYFVFCLPATTENTMFMFVSMMGCSAWGLWQ